MEIDNNSNNIQCEQLLRCYNDMIEKGTKIVDEANEEEIKHFYNYCKIQLIKIKSLQNITYKQLSEKKAVLTNKINELNKLSLQYNNLLYKEHTIKLDIANNKDITTNNINQIEEELNQKLVMLEYNSNIKEFNNNTIKILLNEEEERKKKMKELKVLNSKHEVILKKLDKKRKFIDELPNKINLIKDTANEVEDIFNIVIKPDNDNNKASTNIDNSNNKK